MASSPFVYFTDAVLRAPTIGCMLMCLAAALVGVVVFLKKESLLGESLSHAVYPGVILGTLSAGILDLNEEQEFFIASLVMFGGFFTALIGLWSINFLQRRLHIRSDSALCFVLSVFFGVGLTLASQIQFSYSSLYRQAQLYLYGQAATMTDIHILIYGVLSAIVIVVLFLFYKEIHVISFDPQYAKSLGIKTQAVDGIVFFLIILAVLIGIRSVGVVLMSAMLIAPAVAARQYTNKLYKMFILSGFFGLLSGFAGNYLSIEISEKISASNTKITLPTGPMIVILASAICLLSILFAPRRGLILRIMRIAKFRHQCMCENLLKAIWRFEKEEISFDEIAKIQSAFPWHLRFIISCLIYQKWLKKSINGYSLTAAGKQRGAHIIRLHRLWEVYLVEYLGVGAERVHKNAEEMEHILTPELERELTMVLNNPKHDPHQQPIPSNTSFQGNLFSKEE
jgi:manganese/zinc/iron transport system permease protein